MMGIYAGQEAVPEAKARGSRNMDDREGLETCQKATLC